MPRIAASILFVLITLFSGTAFSAVDMSQSRGDVLSYVGSFNESIPIAVAPGLAGMQPSLALQYSSAAGNGLYGYGWNLDITRIERDSRKGAPKYDNSDTYLLVMKGARQALIPVGGNEYRVANESAFLKITRTVSGWEIRDRKRTIYTLAAPWPMAGLKQFSWSLSRVVDVNGNNMDYSYADGGMGHRLTRIRYGVNNRVTFQYEARPDPVMSYRSGLRSDIKLRLSAVHSYAGNRLASHIGFSYKPPALHDKRSLLSKAMVFDIDGTLPSRSTQFSYTLQNQSVADGSWDVLPTFRSQTTNRNWIKSSSVLVDVNGDGIEESAAGKLWRSGKNSFKPPFILPDAGISHYSYVRSSRTYTVQRLSDVPRGFQDKVTIHYRERAIVDMNGDGYLDWVFRDAAGVWRLSYHNGKALNSSYEAWADPSGSAGLHALYDVNADGLPDLLYLAAATPSSYGAYWTVYLNTGTAFAAQGYRVYLAQWPISDYSPRTILQPRSFMSDTVPAILTHQAWDSKPLMTSVTDQASGLSKTVTYALQAGITDAPALKLWVVRRIRTSARNVEAHSSVYTYRGGLFVPSKMEFRGFATATQKDEQTGILTTTTYAQDLNFQGRPTRVETSLHGVTLSSISTSWAARAYNAGKRHFAYPASVHRLSYDLNGVLLKDSTATSTYDNFGHVLTSVTADTDGFRKSIFNTYSGTDSCAATATTVTRKHWVKNGIPASVLNSATYNRYMAIYLHPLATTGVTADVRLANIRLNRAAVHYINAVTIRNWGYHLESYQVTVSDPSGACWKVRHLLEAQVTATTPAGSSTRISSFAYNGKGLLSSETIEPGSNIWQKTTYAYDAFGNRITTTVTGAGIAPRTTSVVYDSNGQFPFSTTNAQGHSETYAWDARTGNRISLTGPNGLKTTWQYDGFGRKIREDRADGTFTRISYEDLITTPALTWPGKVTTTASGSNPDITMSDAYGRVRVHYVDRDMNGRWLIKRTDYNRLGQVSRQSLPYRYGATPLWSTYTYDALGRVLTATSPKGDVARSSYQGLSVSATNAKGQSTITEKNSQGKVIRVTDAAGGVMTYTYDGFGHLVRTQDAGGNITRMAYDARGRKKWMQDPDMGYWSYDYDALGNLTRQIDAKGQVTTMTYDKLGRMRSRSEPEGISRWYYDTKWVGALSGETSPGAGKSYVYDRFGRVMSSTTTINGQSYVVDTSYDRFGRVSTVSYPLSQSWNRLTVRRNYNNFNHLQSLSNDATHTLIWQANAVDELGRITRETFGNQVVTDHIYNPLRGTLKQIKSRNAAGRTVQSNLYVYDVLGNMQRRVDFINRVDESFTYDNLNRLTGASWTPGASLTAPAGYTAKTYHYDAIGNITYKSDVGAYTYHPYHPHAVQTAGGNSYIYDTHGNMVRGAGRTLHWTSFNKPSGIWTTTGYTGFAYDAGHNRISKTTPTTETHYIGKLFERQVMNGITKDVNYIYAGSRLVSQVEEVSGITTVKYIHSDHLGSISMITDAGGAVLERLSFDAFGKPRNANGTDAATPITSSHATRGYTGHEMDASTGLINMNARLYDPVLGRFISADTIVPSPGNMQAYNRYAYVLNNPLAYTDPSGHSWWTSFRDSFVVPIAQQVVTWAVAAAIMVGSAAIVMPMDPSIAYGIGGFTSSLAFGGNGKENITSGVMAAATYKIGHSGFKPGTRYLLHGALTATNYGINGGNPLQGFILGVTSAGFNGAIVGVKTGNGFTDFAVHVTLSSMIGGTTNVAIGGSFADGASNAARIMLMNEMGNVVMDRLTRMAMRQGSYVNTSADNAAFGMRPDDPAQVKQLADTVMLFGIFPVAAPVATTLGVSLHILAGRIESSYNKALIIDATTIFGSNVFGGSLPANAVMYGTGILMENPPSK